MKQRKTLTLSVDIIQALDELSEKYNIPVSDIVEVMYRAIGGKQGIEQIILGNITMRTQQASDEQKKEPDKSEVVRWLIDKYAKPVGENGYE